MAAFESGSRSKVGEPYHGEVPPEGVGTRTRVLNDMIEAAIVLPAPQPHEVQAFKGPWEFGFVSDTILPGGLLMAGVTYPSALPAQANVWPLEFAIDPVDSMARCPAGSLRVKGGERTMFAAFLVDSTDGKNLVRAIRAFMLPSELMQEMGAAWCAYRDGVYEDWYEALVKDVSGHDLWAAARKFTLDRR